MRSILFLPLKPVIVPGWLFLATIIFILLPWFVYFAPRSSVLSGVCPLPHTYPVSVVHQEIEHSLGFCLSLFLVSVCFLLAKVVLHCGEGLRSLVLVSVSRTKKVGSILFGTLSVSPSSALRGGADLHGDVDLHNCLLLNAGLLLG
ncbi:hypothetical protein ABKV19_000467 [Rosa sericea]